MKDWRREQNGTDLPSSSALKKGALKQSLDICVS